MNLEQYVQSAIRTESQVDEVVVDPVVLSRILRVFIASGTMLDMLKKNVFYGKPFNVPKWEDSCATIAQCSRDLQRGEYVGLSNPQTQAIDPRVFHALIGVATEATEMMEALYKSVILGDTIDWVNVAEELGDVSWYEAILVDALKLDWEQILVRNIAKLRARYPQKFTADAAINRDLTKEREILEGKTL